METVEKVRVRCPRCGSVALARPGDVGRKTYCWSCRQLIVLAAAAAPSPDERVGVSCRLCQTRMSVAARHVGRQVKCPDCGALTEVRPPTLPDARPAPAALEGEQYELWEEDPPSGAAQETLVPVTCRLCQTLMYARADQVGERITCPDCGVETVVRAPAPVVRRAEAPDAGDEYGVDALPDDEEAPETTREVLQRAEADVAAQRAATERRHKKRPRAPLLVGVWGYLKSDRVVSRHLAFSVGLAAVGLIAADGVRAVSMFKQGFGILADASSILGVAMILIATLGGYLWLGAFASLFYATVAESSVGNDRIYHRIPVDPLAWAGDGLHLVMALAASAAPGYLYSLAAGLNPLATAGAVAVSLALCLPVVILSQLEVGSAFGVLSPGLLAALAQAPGSWLTLILESTAMAAIAAGCAWGIASHGALVIAPAAPLAVFLLLLYGRLLGRLAWVVAEG